MVRNFYEFLFVANKARNPRRLEEYWKGPQVAPQQVNKMNALEYVEEDPRVAAH